MLPPHETQLPKIIVNFLYTLAHQNILNSFAPLNSGNFKPHRPLFRRTAECINFLNDGSECIISFRGFFQLNDNELNFLQLAYVILHEKLLINKSVYN